MTLGSRGTQGAGMRQPNPVNVAPESCDEGDGYLTSGTGMSTDIFGPITIGPEHHER